MLLLLPAECRGGFFGGAGKQKISNNLPLCHATSSRCNRLTCWSNLLNHDDRCRDQWPYKCEFCFSCRIRNVYGILRVLGSCSHAYAGGDWRLLSKNTCLTSLPYHTPQDKAPCAHWNLTPSYTPVAVTRQVFRLLSQPGCFAAPTCHCCLPCPGLKLPQDSRIQQQHARSNACCQIS